MKSLTNGKTDLGKPGLRLLVACILAACVHLAILAGWRHSGHTPDTRPATVTWLDAGLAPGTAKTGSGRQDSASAHARPQLSTPAHAAPAATLLVRHPGAEAGSPMSESGHIPKSQRAAYMALWRARVEATGTRHFPRGLLGSGRTHRLLLAVTINADGHVTRARVARSSGDPALDRAALRILSDAAPFPAFPPAMKAHAQQISFTYEWEFLPSSGHSAQAALSLGSKHPGDGGKSP